MAIGIDQKKAHFDLTNVGLRAQATAAGLVQLCKELQRAGALGSEAIDRIKDVVSDEIVLCGSRTGNRTALRREVRERLDRIFAGEEELGDGHQLTQAGV